MAKLPCVPQSRVFTFKETGETMSYDQVRQYLMENPDIWLGAKEGKEVANALKDVESTAKALEGVNQNDLPLARDTASNIVKEYEQAQKEVESLNEERGSLTDAEKDAIVKKSGYVKSVKYSGYYEFSTGASVKRKTKQEIIDAYYDKKIKAAKKDAPNEKVLELYRNQDREYSTPQKISEAYHADKKARKETELVKAVEDLLGGKEVAMPKAPSGPVSAPALTESQKAGEKEMDALQDGDSITTKNPIRLLKGIYGKRNADGTIRSAHTGVDGIFSSITEKIAKRYEGEEGMVVFEVPASVTVEAIQIYRKKIGGDEGVSKLRPMETEAINNSKAQVVKLITFDSRGEEAQYIIKDPALRKLGYKPSEKAALSPEQELKQAFDKWKSETGKLGIVPNWERQAKADIELFNAAKKYLLTKIGQGAYAFEQFLKDLAKAKVENIDEDRSKWKKFYNDTIKEAAPAEEGKATTPPPPVTPPPPTGKREMPEGEGKETEKPILGRAFRGTTDEALAEKLAKMGLYRKPASIEEADKIGAETVALMGVDKAIELGVKGDVPNGFVRMGIFKAILADLKKQRDALVIKEGPAGEQAYMDALDEINDKRAEAMAAFSPSVTAAGQILRGFQEIIRNEEFEFDYEFRKDNFKTLFGDEAYTKEIDERFKEYDKKLKDAAKKRKELENRIAELEAQGIVDNINQEKKTSPVSFFKQAAERVRKLKFSRPGMFSAATPATLAWDATIEAVAVVLDASGTLEQAIVAGIKKLKTTDWYKSLTDAKKSAAENEVAKYVKDGYILKATIDEDGIIQIPSGLLRSYVTAGINDAQAIIDDMLSYLKEADSEITASDVRTAILEAGKREAPTQNQITQSVNDLKSIIRMLGQLEKIRAGERITKNEGKKKQMRDAVANLKKTIEDKHLEVFGTKPGALTDEQRLANIKKNAQKRINDLRAMKPRPEVRERVKWDAEMEALANEEFRLKEKWDDEFAQARYKKLSDWQKFGRGAYLGINLSKTVMSGMTDLGIILIQGATLPFRSAKLTAKALANMAKVILSHDEFVRQQRVINESDLYRVARKSNLDMPQVSGMEIDKLEESSLGAFGEKAFDVLFKPFDYIPKVGPKMYEWAKKHINIPRVLNRMQTSYLNTLRYGTFALSARSLMEKGITYQDNPQAYKDVAEAINTMSGRTKIGAENSPAVMRFLNLVFYSPKNAMSLLKIYTPYVLIEIGKKRAEASGFAGMSEAQQTMIRTLAGAIAIPSALYLMMKALTGWDEEDEEEKKKEGNVSLDIENPQSSAFAKIRIGNQLFDPWGGRAQLITLQARLIIHYVGNGRAYKDPYTGIEKRLSEVQRFKHPVGLAGEYIKGKFSPYARAAFTLGTSEQVKGKRWYVRRPLDGGKEFDILDPIKESYTNITYESVKELYGNQPLTVSEIMTLFLIAGGGVTTLNNQDEQSILTKVREKLSPEEDERRKFAKNLASYIKDENMIGAEEVYDQAIGVKGNEKKSELITKRREHADKLFSSAKKDGIASKWTIDVEDRPKVFALLYKNEPIKTTSRTKEEKKVVYDAYNNLTPEEKAEIKFDYEMEYEELINIAKGLDHLNKTPGKYLKEVNQVEWVKEYKKATGKK